MAIAASAADPYLLRFDTSSGRVRNAYKDTNGYTRRAAAINGAIRNLALLSLGQSLRTNATPTLYIPTNTSKIDVLNIYDGAMYAITGMLPGCDAEGYSLGPGHPMARVADLLVTNNKFDRVIVVPLGIGGTIVSDWANVYSDSVQVAMRRLAYLGITPATTGVTFAIEWGQGSSDNFLSTSQASYQADLLKVIANSQAAGFSGRFFVALESYYNGTTSSAIRAAQAAVVNGTTVFQSGDTDTLDATNRQDSGGHWNDTGAAAMATLVYNAMHASGAPF